MAAALSIPDSLARVAMSSSSRSTRVANHPLGGVVDDRLRLEDGVYVPSRTSGVVDERHCCATDDEHLPPDAHGRELGCQIFEETDEGRPVEHCGLDAGQRAGVHEDATVGERSRRADQRAGVDRAVGGDEPPVLEEPRRRSGPGRYGQAVVVKEMLGGAGQQRVPSLVAGELRLVRHHGGLLRRPGLVEYGDELRHPPQGLVTIGWRGRQATTDLRGHPDKRVARRERGAIVGPLVVACHFVMVGN